MGLRINTSLPALAITRILDNNSQDLAKSYQKLASGQEITQAGDDPAGLSISEHLKNQIYSLRQARRNASGGISFIQIAEGGMSEIGNILIRVRELGIQAASDTIGDAERLTVDEESRKLLQEVNRIANSTNFMGISLLNGGAPKKILDIQVGIHGSEDDRIQIDTEQLDVRADALGLANLSFETTETAFDGLPSIDGALDCLLKSRTFAGALQNRLESAVRNLEYAQENLSDAHSKIADVDFAAESTKLMRLSILKSAGIAVLAQAQTSRAMALRLLD